MRAGRPDLSVLERAGLLWCFGPPLSWHKPRARLLGVRIVAPPTITVHELESAERDSVTAVRYATMQIVVLVAGSGVMPLVAMVLLAMAFEFTGEVSNLSLKVVIVATIAPFWGLVFLLGRQKVRYSSTGVAIALAVAQDVPCPDPSAQPRMRYVLSRLVPSSRWGLTSAST